MHPTAAATTIDRDGDRVVFRKRRAGDAGRTRLRREHALLERLPHPGVAEVLSFDDGTTDATLTLAYAGNRTIASTHHPGVDECGRLIAAVAETVAELHRLGVVHGALTADHLVLDADGRPVLVGFGTCADRADDDAARPADDVHDLGLLLGLLLDRHAEGGRLASMAATPTAWRVRRAEATAARELRALARDATAADPARRPTARELAARAARSVPTVAPRRGQRATRPRRPKRGAVPAVALVIAVTATLVWLVHPGDRPTVGTATAARAPTPSGTAATLDPPAPLTDAASHGTGSTPTSIAPAAAHIVPAGVIDHDGRRYRIGEPGDEIAIGDFWCHGTDAAVVLRPGSGEIFVFDGWADERGDLVAAASTVVPIDAHLAIDETDQPGCPRLRVSVPGGGELAVALPDPPAPFDPTTEGTSP